MTHDDANNVARELLQLCCERLKQYAGPLTLSNVPSAVDALVTDHADLFAKHTHLQAEHEALRQRCDAKVDSIARLRRAVLRLVAMLVRQLGDHGPDDSVAVLLELAGALADDGGTGA